MDWWRTPGTTYLAGRKTDVFHYLSTHFQRNYPKNALHSHWAFKGQYLVSPCSRSYLWADLHQKNVKIQANCLQWHLLFFSRTKQILLQYFSSAHTEQSSNKNQVPSERSSPFSGLHSLMTQLMWNRALSFGNLLCVREGLKVETLLLPPACQTVGSPLDEGTAVGAGKASHLDPRHDPHLAGSPRQSESPRWHHCLLGQQTGSARWYPAEGHRGDSTFVCNLQRNFSQGKKTIWTSLGHSRNAVIASAWPHNLSISVHICCINSNEESYSQVSGGGRGTGDAVPWLWDWSFYPTSHSWLGGLTQKR